MANLPSHALDGPNCKVPGGGVGGGFGFDNVGAEVVTCGAVGDGGVGVDIKGQTRKANLRVFIEKLNRRRKRILCSSACYAALHSALVKLGSANASANSVDKRKQPLRETTDAGKTPSGRVAYGQLREVLRRPPQQVPAHVLRDLVDVARSYDSAGDGFISVDELLCGALDVQPGALDRLRSILPLLALLMWVAIAPLIFVPGASWSTLDAFYFAVTFLLTVGQDRIVPDGDGVKLCSVFYMLVGIGFVAWGWASCAVRLLLRYETVIRALLEQRDNADLLAADGLGPSNAEYALEDLLGSDHIASQAEALVERQEQFRRQAEDQQYVIGGIGGDVGPSACTGVESSLRVAAAADFVGKNAGRAAKGSDQKGSSILPEDPCEAEDSYLSNKRHPRAEFRSTVAKRLAVCVVGLFTLLGLGAATAVALSGGAVSFTNALYWSVLTCTSTGSGGDVDLHLGTQATASWQRGVRLLFCLIAVPSWVFAICGLGELALRVRSAHVEEEINSRTLPMDLLIDLDDDGDGISKLEFLCATLMVMDKVSAHDLWQVLDHFRRLDVDGSGVLRRDHLAVLRRGLDDDDRQQLRTDPLWPSSHVCNMPAQKQLVNAEVPAAVVWRDAQAGFTNRGISSERGEGMTMPSSVSPVESQFDPSVLSTSFTRGRRQTSGVRFATSVGELPPTEGDVASSCQDGVDEMSSFDPRSFMKELYQDTKNKLAQREAELAALLRTLQQTEHAMRQVVAERQALHGEVMFSQHKIAELHARLQEQQKEAQDAKQASAAGEALRRELERALSEAERLRGEADRQRVEAERNRVEAERRRDDADRCREESDRARVVALAGYEDAKRNCEEAKRGHEEAKRGQEEAKRGHEEVTRSRDDARRVAEEARRGHEEAVRVAQAAQHRCAETEVRIREAENRSEVAERNLAEVTERTRIAEKQWQLEADKKVQEIHLKCAQLDVQRQSEVHGALLELQAVTHGQHALRTELRRAPSATLSIFGQNAVSSEPLASTQRLRGHQPWEVWERAASKFAQAASLQHEQNPGSLLLSGKVREHAERLDQSAQALAVRQRG
eukprot:TRINITY_DN10031_c0_g1_i1.p1 TRINITY_DN10031_c0_g1~~TRINITY_DN10031_c0_g1_i1.p1  ORF type:complete len:1069 (-),score=204.48 TRINITY_DN10031_c0_g1_i1:752-3958(-)